MSKRNDTTATRDIWGQRLDGSREYVESHTGTLKEAMEYLQFTLHPAHPEYRRMWLDSGKPMTFDEQ